MRTRFRKTPRGTVRRRYFTDEEMDFPFEPSPLFDDRELEIGAGPEKEIGSEK